MQKLTSSQKQAVQWLKKHGNTGVFEKTSRYQTILAQGEIAPFTRSTWNALEAAGLIKIDDKRVTLVQL